MPNIAAVLKEEIVRLARKEVRAEVDALKRAAGKYRVEIADLKRKVVGLESSLGKLAKRATKEGSEPIHVESADAKLRFRAGGLLSHRKRLELSRNEAALLLDASPQTIANWESGTTRPRGEHMPKIAAFRKLSPRKARAALEQVQQP